jgi:hypothetical protein
MIKSILFTKNPEVMGSLNEVAEWAEENGVYFTCLVNTDDVDYEPGTVLLTTKGNTLVVLETTLREDAYPEAKSTFITNVVEETVL